MKTSSKCIAWAAIVVLLGLAVCSFLLRWNNERDNREIVTIADFNGFRFSASHANRCLDEVLAELREAGVQAVALHELSIRDLAHRGEIVLQPFFRLMAEAAIESSDLYDVINEGITWFGNTTPVGRDNLVAISPFPETSAFLYERLSARYISEAQALEQGVVPEFFLIEADGNDYFILNFEHGGRYWGEVRTLDVAIGFDEERMEQLEAHGFSILLRPSMHRGSNDYYWEEYERQITRFGVDLMIFGLAVFDGSVEHVRRAYDLINRHGIIVGIVEAPDQVQFFPQEGLPRLMSLLHYQVNRVYSTVNDEFVDTPRDRYHRWVRAIIDRNIRMLYIVPFRDNALGASENLDDTIATIADFVATIEDKGYTFTSSLSPLNTTVPRTLNRLALGLSLALAASLYLTYLFSLKERTAIIIAAAACVAIVGIVALRNFLPITIAQFLALSAAMIYPSFSSLLFLIYLKNYKHHAFLLKIVCVLGILFAVNGLAMYTIVSSMADMRYIMNVLTYRGVLISLFVPLTMFCVNYLVIFNEEDNIIKTLRRLMMKTPTYLVLGVGGIGLVFLYIHLARSGHTAGMGVMQFELRVREFLESTFLARPRFREIIIGYPSLIAMVYLYHRYKKSLILLILGLGVMMGSSSMINSFCHGFTSIYISMYRTASGLLLGAFTAVAALIGVMILERIFWFVYRNYVQPLLGETKATE